MTGGEPSELAEDALRYSPLSTTTVTWATILMCVITCLASIGDVSCFPSQHLTTSCSIQTVGNAISLSRLVHFLFSCLVPYATNEESTLAVETTKDYDQPRRMMLDVYACSKSPKDAARRPVLVRKWSSHKYRSNESILYIIRCIFMVVPGKWAARICSIRMRRP